MNFSINSCPDTLSLNLTCFSNEYGLLGIQKVNTKLSIYLKISFQNQEKKNYLLNKKQLEHYYFSCFIISSLFINSTSPIKVCFQIILSRTHNSLNFFLSDLIFYKMKKSTDCYFFVFYQIKKVSC